MYILFFMENIVLGARMGKIRASGKNVFDVTIVPNLITLLMSESVSSLIYLSLS